MLRTVIRSEPILLNILTKGKSFRKNEILRAYSICATKKFDYLNTSSYNKISSKPQTLWQPNFVRNYASYPEHIKVLLPALSPTMEQGTLISWAKKEGDKLNEGDLLAEMETDKATMGFETPEEGYLAKILIPAGTKDIKIGKLLCIIVSNEADIAAFKDYKDDSPASAPPPAAAAPPPAAPAPAAAPAAAPTKSPAGPSPLTAVEQKGGDRVYASPMAKKLAEAQKLRLEGRGSGVHGSIKSQDLAGMKAGAPARAGSPSPATTAAPSAGGYIDIPVTNMRKVIGKRLTESKQMVPHYYVTMECQIDNLIKLRLKVNKKYEKKGIKVSVNDFIIKAAAIANRKVPAANSYLMDTIIRQFDNVDVCVAVSTEKGLITPIIFSADRKGVIDISKEVKILAEKARQNKLQPHEFQGGTLTVSNLGMFNVSSFTAVINPPQSCILAVGTTKKRLILDPDNIKGFKEINIMTVTLSSDHRIVDGAVAAQWLQHFRDFMQDPENMIL